MEENQELQDTFVPEQDEVTIVIDDDVQEVQEQTVTPESQAREEDEQLSEDEMERRAIAWLESRGHQFGGGQPAEEPEDEDDLESRIFDDPKAVLREHEERAVKKARAEFETQLNSMKGLVESVVKPQMEDRIVSAVRAAMPGVPDEIINELKAKHLAGQPIEVLQQVVAAPEHAIFLAKTLDYDRLTKAQSAPAPVNPGFTAPAPGASSPSGGGGSVQIGRAHV